MMRQDETLWLKRFCLALMLAFLFGFLSLLGTKASESARSDGHLLYLPWLMRPGGDNPPPPQEARFFVEPDRQIGSAGFVIDKSGGMHLAYSDRVPDAERPKATYAYCSPTAVCEQPQSWVKVTLPTALVDEVQLAVTDDGRPRLLIRTTSQLYTAIAPGRDFYYAACEQSCSNASSWTITYLLSNHGTSSFDVADQITPQRSFALDPQGRPRFVYQDNNYFYQEPDHLGAYYVFCDEDCTDSKNWSETLITEYAPYDYEVIKYPALTFTQDGRPRLLAYLIPLGEGGDGIYYFACESGCGAGENWERVGLYARGNGTTASWDLALDSRDRPRFLFYQGEGSGAGGWGKLHYGWCNQNCLAATSWDNAEVGLPVGSGEHPDLALDAENRPFMAYVLQGGGGTGYARCTGRCETQQPQWAHVVLDTATSLEADFPVPLPSNCDEGIWDSIAPMLALDPSGQPRLAHDAAYHGRCWIDVDPSDNVPPEYLFWQIRHSVRVVFPPQS